MQIQENRRLLEKASAMISQKAYSFVDQAIERTLQDWRLGDIQSEDGGFRRALRGTFEGEKAVSVHRDIQSEDGGFGGAPRGACVGEKGVSALEYSAWTRYTERVHYRASRF